MKDILSLSKLIEENKLGHFELQNKDLLIQIKELLKNIKNQLKEEQAILNDLKYK